MPPPAPSPRAPAAASRYAADAGTCYALATMPRLPAAARPSSSNIRRRRHHHTPLVSAVYAPNTPAAATPMMSAPSMMMARYARYR